MSHTKDLLEIIKNDPDFVDPIITDIESQCFTYNLQSVAWVGPKVPHVKKLPFQKSRIETLLILQYGRHAMKNVYHSVPFKES